MTNNDTTKKKSSSYREQIVALIKKTLTIKKRNRMETITEFLIGIYYIVILIILKFTIPKVDINGVVFSSIPPMYPINTTTSHLATLAYIPDVAGEANNLITYLSSSIPTQSFVNESLFIDAYTKNPGQYWGAVVFNTLDTINDTIDYSIRINDSMISNYQFSPYLAVQTLLLDAFTQLKTGMKNLTVSPSTAEYAVPNNPWAINTFNIVFPIYFPLFFMYSMQQLIIMLVTEKKDGIKEGLKVMGMKEGAYWLSNIIFQLVMNTLLIIMALIICYVASIFHYTSPIIVFIEFFMFSLTIIGISFFVSTFLNAPKTASSIAALVIMLGIGLSCLYQLYLKNKMESIKYLFFLFSPCAFGDFLTALSYGEAQENGIQWNSSHVQISLAYMLLDFVLYSLMAWYAIEVYPGEYGSGKGWFFFLDKNYWSQSIDKGAKGYNSINNYPDHEPHGIEISHLSKDYKHKTERGKMVKAVNDLSFNIASGTIFALLGHNGAGKSTTMGILTGMIPPSSGNAFINSLSVTNQMDFIRRDIGFCPQQNILYNQLTCSEHLRLFGRIKGVPESLLEDDIIQAINDVDLLEKKDTLASSLSGGMKRRLSLAMALIGNPSIIFLDECTTGLDPFARHKIWDLLQRKKVGKTIVMTTHFMEEAELLGEKIAIMNHGKLRCMGTAMELKTLFGLGYILSVSIDQPLKLASFESFLNNYFKDALPSKQNAINIEKIQFNQQQQDNSNNNNTTNNYNDSILEVSYSLSYQNTEILTLFFEELESQQHQLGVSRVGISATTLEEVFLKIQSEEDDHDNHH